MSLIEVLVSMGVLVIASFTVATSATTSFSAVNKSELTNEMETALRETMESVHAVAFGDLETLDGNKVYATDDDRHVIIEIDVNQVTPNLKSVEVEVFVKERDLVGKKWVSGDKFFQALTYRSAR